jgi:tRNA (adenine57-N1/adenine58-N1)-methyltransferase
VTGPFKAGDRVQLTGFKGRRNTITLAEGGVFHTHRGTLGHDLLIGEPDGSVVVGSDGQHYLALKPLLADYVMSMPRGAAIVYPKDAGQIIASADIALGQRVVEAGVGSGALTLWLLRAVGETGTVHSVERRQEFADVAADNVAGFFEGAPDRWTLTTGDLVEVLDAGEPAIADRVVLDMLAPWETVPAVERALAPGGVVIAYIATVPQLSRTVEALRDSGAFTEPLSTETMVRGWHVDGLAVRPDHRMVAHTGFLVTARRLADGAIAPRTSRRAPKTFSDEDVELWTPGAIGEREKSPKRLRKAARQAAEIADARTSGDDAEPEGH